MVSVSQQEVQDMQEMQMQNAQTLCGIIAHVKDRYRSSHVYLSYDILLTATRGVASVALRSIHHAGECLVSRPEQEEVLTIVNKIHKETGWGINFVIEGLIKKWGWNDQENLQQPLNYGFQQQAPTTSLPPAPPSSKSMPSGIPNPMYARADFGQPIHPYQNYYVAPQHHPGGQTFNHF